MRISDWSSDVCSSDLYALTSRFVGVHGAELDGTRADKTELIRHLLVTEQLDPAQCLMVGDRKHDIHGARANHVAVCSARWGDRKSVVSGKSVSVRVDFGGRRIINKNNILYTQRDGNLNNTSKS